jgi:hypothetical protein
VATAENPEGRAIIAGLLRESIKKHFKEKTSAALGELWQDFDGFCQYPGSDWQQEFLMCRRFSVNIKQLAGGRFVLQTVVTTASVDGKTFLDYYEAGNLRLLAEMIEAKRESRLNRQNRPIGIRVLHQPSEGTAAVRALDFEDTEVILDQARLTPDEQRALGRPTLRCRPFGGKLLEVPAWELRLILGSQITQEDHAETIIEPEDRYQWMRKIRDFVSDCAVEGRALELSKDLVEADDLDHMVVLPPAVRVRGDGGRELRIASPVQANDRDLQKRARTRMDHIRDHGFLVRRPLILH